MRTPTTPLVLTLFAVLILLVSARHSSTNSERFSRGLPPMRPRRLFDADKTGTAHLAKRSAYATEFGCTFFAACCLTVTSSPTYTNFLYGSDCAENSFVGASMSCTNAQDTPLCCDFVIGDNVAGDQCVLGSSAY